MSRNEFLERRNVDRGITVQKDVDSEESAGDIPTDKKSTEEEIPLHEIILKLMFEENKEGAAGLSVNDIFWKSSDPMLRESQVEDVLEWLLHHRRVEHRAGKYSLDRFEMLEQIELEKPKVVEKAKVSKPPVKKSPKKKAPVIVEPTVPKETTPPKATVPETTKIEKAVITPKIEEPKKTPNIPKPTEPEHCVVPDGKVDGNRKVNMVLLMIAAGFFAYSCYLLISMSNLTTTMPSKQLQDEIISTQSELEQLSKKEVTADNKSEIVEKRLDLIQVITLKTSEQLTNQQQNISTYNRLKVVNTRLFLSNGFILLLLVFLFYRRDLYRFKRD